MGSIRVLIVDDAVVVRRMLSDIISSDPLLTVVGTAANGKIALKKIPTLKPHRKFRGLVHNRITGQQGW